MKCPTLHCGHLFLATIKMIKHCGWYMCWQVPKIHVPFGPNEEQQITHSPFYVKHWGVCHKSFPISFTWQWHSQSNLGCVPQSMLALSCIFGKLLKNISNIMGHDVKPCDYNLPFSRYFVFIFTSFASIYVAWSMLPKYMQDACGLNFLGLLLQTLWHFFNIVPSC